MSDANEPPAEWAARVARECDEYDAGQPAGVARSRQAAVDRRMKERGELAELIRDTDAWMLGHEMDLADAILAAGWRKLT